MNKALIVIALSAIASILLYLTIHALVPRYNDFPGGGICFHKPQETIDHTIEPKRGDRNLDLLSAY